MKSNSSARIFVILFLSVLFLAGCNRTGEYRQDIAMEELSKLLTPIIPHADSMIRYDADQIHFFMGLPEPYCSDCIVMVQTRSDSVDEFGIFRCNNEKDAESLEEMLDKYLELTLPGKIAYLNDCQGNAPEQVTDEEKSEVSASLTGRVRIYGNYVCYTLLSKEADEDLQNQLRSILCQV